MACAFHTLSMNKVLDKFNEAIYGITVNLSGSVGANLTAQQTGIPEFTTIAIPVAAILGLLLFFNRRKRKAV